MGIDCLSVWLEIRIWTYTVSVDGSRSAAPILGVTPQYVDPLSPTLPCCPSPHPWSLVSIYTLSKELSHKESPLW